jgi:hypothetical protein
MATNTVYFISEQYVKDNSPVSLAADAKLISVSILDAMEVYVQPALGTRLYSKLKALIAAGAITDPANSEYKDLLDNYVSRAVLYHTVSELTTFVRWKITAKSVDGQSSDNGAPADLEELKYFRGELRNKAEFYTQRLIDRLAERGSTHLPEYGEATNEDEIDPRDNAYRTGMALDDDDCPCLRKMGYNDGIRRLD